MDFCSQLSSRCQGTILLALCWLTSVALAQDPSGQHSSAGKDVEKQAEGDWADSRWNQTVVGRFLASNLKTPGGTIAKGLSIRVGNDGEATVCYDTGKPSLRGAWTGGFLKFDGRRFGLLGAPAAAGEWAFDPSASVGWQNVTARHEALHLGESRVVMDTRVGETLVRESPWFEEIAGLKVFTRTLEVAPGHESLTCRLATIPQAVASTSQARGTAIAKLEHDGKALVIMRRGSGAATLTAANGTVNLVIAPRGEIE